MNKEILEEALGKLSREQLRYLRSQSHEIAMIRLLNRRDVFMSATGNLKGFVTCLYVSGILTDIEKIGVMLYFNTDRSFAERLHPGMVVCCDLEDREELLAAIEKEGFLFQEPLFSDSPHYGPYYVLTEPKVGRRVVTEMMDYEDAKKEAESLGVKILNLSEVEEEC